jgi:hypothetical protein
MLSIVVSEGIPDPLIDEFTVKAEVESIVTVASPLVVSTVAFVKEPLPVSEELAATLEVIV